MTNDNYEEVRSERTVVPAAVPGATVGTTVARHDSVTVVRTPNHRAMQIVWFVVGLIDALLAIRFVMRLLGASPDSAFVRLMYGVTDPLIAPFRGIFQTAGRSQYVFEPETLVAIIVYALIGWGIVSLIRIMTQPRGTHPTA